MLTSTRGRHLTFVYDPRGISGAIAAPIAPRPKRLKGLRLGILDNSKWNANKLLRGAAIALDNSIGFGETKYYVKHSFSKDAAPELIAEIVQNCDIVLTAIGDCGSCTSCCIRDAMALEKCGIPTATVVTTEFVRETELQRRALGMDDLHPVIIKHPVSSITEAEIAERVEQICALAPDVWLGQSLNAAGENRAGNTAGNAASALHSCHDDESAFNALAFAACQP
jgi:hypothetical protein